MLKNFHLVAIINPKHEWNLQRFSLEDSLQNTLAGEWENQYKTLIEQKEEREFTINYTLRPGEYFRICPYELPEWLADNNSENIRTIDEFSINASQYRSVKSVVAFARDDENNELMLFQNFTGGQVIKPGGIIFRRNNTYKSIEGSALRLDNKLMAVYFPKSKTLSFRNARSVNKFLPLSGASYEASNKDIRDIVNHDLFECKNAEEIVTSATQFARTEFAILRASEILERLTAKFGSHTAVSVRDRAAEHGIQIQVQEDKIVFPTESADATELLQFLNQQIFRGPLTNELLQTNSTIPYKNVR